VLSWAAIDLRNSTSASGTRGFDADNVFREPSGGRMIDNVGIRVSDLDASAEFYRAGWRRCARC
jgi:hypothetical protein